MTPFARPACKARLARRSRPPSLATALRAGRASCGMGAPARALRAATKPAAPSTSTDFGLLATP